MARNLPPQTPPVAELADLVPLIQGTPGFDAVVEELAKGASAQIDGAWGGAAALACAALLRSPTATPPAPATPAVASALARPRGGASRPTPARGTPSTARSAETPAPPPPGVTHADTAPPPVLLVVLPRPGDVDDFAEDLSRFSRREAVVLPAWEAAPSEERADDPIYAGRVQALRSLQAPPSAAAEPASSAAKAAKAAGGDSTGATIAPVAEGIRGLLKRRKSATPGEPVAESAPPAAPPPCATRPARVVVTSIPALLQPVPTRAELDRATRVLRRGDRLDPEVLVRWLLERGFERSPAVELPGEFCVHGGIIDLFPYAETDPIRIEFFGDEIESLRRFDVQSQRKREDLQSLSMLVPTPPQRTRPAPASPAGAQPGTQAGPQSSERPAASTDADADAADSASPDAGSAPPKRRGRPARAAARQTAATAPAATSPFDAPVEGADGAAEDVESDTALEVQVEEALRRSRPVPGALLGEGHVADWLPTGSWVAVLDLPDLVREGHSYLTRLANPRGYHTVEATLARLQSLGMALVAPFSESETGTVCRLRVESLQRLDSPSGDLGAELDQLVPPGQRLLLACHNVGEAQRVRELLAETTLLREDRVRLCGGSLRHGFRLPDAGWLVVGDHELFRRREVRRKNRRHVAASQARAIDSFLELRPGDLVVHLAKGIARYRGMQPLEKDGKVEDQLMLEFRDNARLYVPVTLIHLVQKYIGGAKSAPQLSALGGSAAWDRKKREAAAAVADMAGEMLAFQAARATQPGLAFPPDSHWQDEFEAAFPYEATPDQVAAVEQLKGDMERPRPMDRLICGDVGYGKTEVAMRAAFKAIDSGRQVAVLVPTTVLAEQHYRTFRERMAEYPFQIESLSRFRSRAEQKQVLEGLATGQVDLVVGTHRLVSQDVKFSDLGLLIIDEEQRFGVAAKDRLKQLRLEIDVLTLSATPIPRTLHQSLLGLRDISNLQTPPVDRVPVETRVHRFDPDLIRRAIVRELNRGGQVYFVHNRIHNIGKIADRLQAIVPEARIGIVHGQLDEDQLEETMVAFVEGRIDVLVATTIIESGLDIPTANTIFIHQADIYGLADLHQLRGRVGRYKHRAYCYLLLEEGRSLTGTAARRLKAIEEFSELGAGFKIAMRDLEIRGAGNLLGTEQSGHIAAVGYELYCQLLETAVRKLRNEPLPQWSHVAIDLPLAAHIPDHYVPAGRLKIEVYRRFSRVTTAPELETMVAELADRFGAPPEPVEMFIELKRLQLLAQPWQIDDLHLEPGYLVLGYRNPGKIRQLVRASGGRLRIVDQRSAYLPLADAVASGRKLLVVVKSLLQQIPFPV